MNLQSESDTPSPAIENPKDAELTKPTAAGPVEESFLSRIKELIELASAAYAIGFIVIMVHTARLNGPVVEAFQFQNIIAGLPVWIPLGVGIWLWPRLRRPTAKGETITIKMSEPAFIILVVSVIVGAALVYFELSVIFGGNLSISESLVLISGSVFATVLSIFFQGYRQESFRTGRFQAIVKLVCVYSGAVFLVVGYAIFGYPRMPQSIGGGHPVPVKIVLKDRALIPLLSQPSGAGSAAAAPSGSDEQGVTSDQVYLFYRTGSYLLVSRGNNQPLVQIPTDQVHAVLWVDSRAK
jgi:hypothetical protein